MTRFLLRLPVTLHEQLRRRADEQGVSLNMLITTLLAGAIGFDLTADSETDTHEEVKT